MDERIQRFKDSAQLAGEICGFPPGKLFREFGLDDFLENQLQEGDIVETIVLKAVAFFCDEVDPRLEVFKFGVLAIGSFLSGEKGRRQPPQQALKDLVAVLQQGGTAEQVQRWIQSHFG